MSTETDIERSEREDRDIELSAQVADSIVEVIDSIDEAAGCDGGSLFFVWTQLSITLLAQGWTVDELSRDLRFWGDEV